MEPTEVKTEDLNAAEDSGSSLIDKEGYTLEYKTFDKTTPAAGFGYYTIQYKDTETAKKMIGEPAVLAALNSALTSSLRVKAKSKLPEKPKTAEELPAWQEATAKMLAETNGVLLSIDDAEHFVPGSREKTSVATLMREAKEAAEAGDKPLAILLFKRAKELLDKQSEDSLASLGSLD